MSQHPRRSTSGNQPGDSRWQQAAKSAESGGPGKWVDEDRYNSTEYLGQETRRIQQESASSTRRALNRLNETQGIAQANLSSLNQQSEQLYAAERKMEDSQRVATANSTKVTSLKTLNRFFMLPSFGAQKKAQKAEEKLRKQQEEDRIKGKSAKQREKDWKERDSRNEALEQEMGRGQGQQQMYTTPGGLVRDEFEDEIDSNLGQLTSGLARLKMMGQAMSNELDGQSRQLDRLADRTDSTRDQVTNLNRRVRDLSGRK